MYYYKFPNFNKIFIIAIFNCRSFSICIEALNGTIRNSRRGIIKCEGDFADKHPLIVFFIQVRIVRPYLEGIQRNKNVDFFHFMEKCILQSTKLCKLFNFANETWQRVKSLPLFHLMLGLATAIHNIK